MLHPVLISKIGRLEYEALLEEAETLRKIQRLQRGTFNKRKRGLARMIAAILPQRKISQANTLTDCEAC